MLRHVWIRIKRKPLLSAAIFLFAAVIALALCGLRNGNEKAQEHYNEIYDTIKVRCTVTSLDGAQSDQLLISQGMIALFTGGDPLVPTDLQELLEDVQIKGSLKFRWNSVTYTLTGITSTDIEPGLWPENRAIFWKENADSGFFLGNGMECIIPSSLQEKLQEADLPTDVFPLHIDGDAYLRDFDGELTVLGVYEGKNSKTLYCPWDTYVSITEAMGNGLMAEALHATLRSNRDLPLLRKTAAQYFARPDPGYLGSGTAGDYYLALDINDSPLIQAKTDLENSMAVNRIAAGLILALSAAAGALIGFLMIRNRRREIALMRTMGTPDSRIYFGFAAEQMLFAVLGAAAGGSVFRWDPASWLILFVCVYFAGLSAALLLMLRRNLLTAIKEDE